MKFTATLANCVKPVAYRRCGRVAWPCVHETTELFVRLLLASLPVWAASMALTAPAGAADLNKQAVGTPLARFKLLEPGAHRYLRYKAKGSQRTAVDIWTRTTTFEPLNGKRSMHIMMRWDEVSGPVAYLEQDSWFEVDSFRPLTHVRRLKRTGSDAVETGGYRFLPDKIVGMAELPENLRQDFAIASSEAAYNFEYDMEFLQALPLSAGYSVSIPFYDPGDAQTPTARYTFKVAGSDRIRGADGVSRECWLVTADYNTDTVKSRFWFDKKSQVMIREEQPQEDGSILIKSLLAPESADASTGSAKS
jgi:hypothetical protein